MEDLWAVERSLMKRPDQQLRRGDTLISSANSWNLVGKCCWIPDLEWPSTFGGFVTVLRPSSGELNDRYLYRWFSSPSVQALARSFGQQTTNISNLNLARCLQMLVPVPPIEEQRRIADVLDRAEAIVAKRRESLRRLDELAKSLFLDMFGALDAVTDFGSVILNGPTNGLYRPSSDYGSGSPILRIDGFDSEGLKVNEWKRVRVSRTDLERYSLAIGDIVINRVNALSHLGKSALIERLDEPAVFESNMMRIRLDSSRVLPRYVIAWLQTSSVKQQVLAKAKKAINQASINQSDVRALEMPSAPLRLQEEFVYRVEHVLVQREIVRLGVATTLELFLALQQRAFSGRL